MNCPDPLASVGEAQALARAIVDTVANPLLILDRDKTIVVASRSFHVLFDTTPDSIAGRSVYSFTRDPWGVRRLRFLFDGLLAQRTFVEACEIDLDVRTGERRTMRANVRTIAGGRAGPLTILALDDVTALRAAERSASELAQRQELLAEGEPRAVTEILQIVGTTLGLKTGTAQTEEARLQLEDSHRRVLAVATVHGHARACRHGDRIELAPFLARLCDGVITDAAGPCRIAQRRRIDDVTVALGDAVALGLVVAELVANALRHAFVGRTEGEVTVAYEIAGDGWRLAVTDNGGGRDPEVAGESKPGIGLAFVAALGRRLDARLEGATGPHGTTVSVTHGRSTSRLSEAA